ncbi:hypothetical protein G7Y41_06655 [Schaalia sp. ZJ405]|uniref:hypothetical protein n=1 Tax=Schaalia sp. ZJ405 TaxID=2709403 RepID=UPI0013ECBC39|nr:hypothetical protein [Schaalia sp. ZJ405]QPK80744.1 hypothetical protein G7Y41_06655 [Schaalia sp. ZJ405]
MTCTITLIRETFIVHKRGGKRVFIIGEDDVRAEQVHRVTRNSSGSNHERGRARKYAQVRIAEMHTMLLIGPAQKRWRESEKRTLNKYQRKTQLVKILYSQDQ